MAVRTLQEQGAKKSNPESEDDKWTRSRGKRPEISAESESVAQKIWLNVWSEWNLWVSIEVDFLLTSSYGGKDKW